MSAHLSPVVLKHHETGLWICSAWTGGGCAPVRPAPRTPRVQPAKPAHTEPSKRQVKGLTESKTKEEKVKCLCTKTRMKERARVWGNKRKREGMVEKEVRGWKRSVSVSKHQKRAENGVWMNRLSLQVSVYLQEVCLKTVWLCPPCGPCHPVWSQHHSIVSRDGHAALWKQTNNINISV